MHVSASHTMPTAFRTPTKRKQVSARLPESQVEKLQAVVRLWKAQAEAQKEDPEGIDQSWVIEVLLGHALDAELAQFGGLPETEAQWKEALRALRNANHQ